MVCDKTVFMEGVLYDVIDMTVIDCSDCMV